MRERHLRSADDAWFAEMLRPLVSDGRHVHPTRALLYAYLKKRLPDRWLSVEEWQASSDHWTLTSVSQHLLCCRSCQSEISQMRHAQLRSRWEETVAHLGSPHAVAMHLRGFALVAALLLLLNGTLLLFFPAPGETLTPCGTPAKGMQIKDTSAEKFGPPRPEETSSRLCLHAPAPQLWQIWWAPPMLAIWIPVLLLHLGWFLLTRTELRQRREWVGVSGLPLMRSTSPVLFR